MTTALQDTEHVYKLGSYSIRLPFFQILSDYSTEIFALLACLLEALIWKAIFSPCHAILWDRNYFRAIFSALSTFLFTLFTFYIVSRTASKGFQQNSISYQRFNSQSWNFSFCKWSNCSFMQCIWFFNLKHTKIDFGRLRLGVIFTFKTPWI